MLLKVQPQNSRYNSPFVTQTEKYMVNNVMFYKKSTYRTFSNHRFQLLSVTSLRRRSAFSVVLELHNWKTLIAS